MSRVPTRAKSRFNNDLRYRDESDPAQVHLTPEYVLEPVRADLGGTIDLDPCTLESNPTGARRIMFPPTDGASAPWRAENVFVNPPYGKARERWAMRCAEAGSEGIPTILLMPAHTDTRLFHAICPTATAVVFVKGRLKFDVLRPNRRRAAASHPSLLLGWNTALDACASLGLRWEPGGSET